jgi:hypothetical protein
MRRYESIGTHVKETILGSSLEKIRFSNLDVYYLKRFNKFAAISEMPIQAM